MRVDDPKPPHPYQTPQDVPAALQDALRFSYETGVDLNSLAIIYRIPVPWLELFCLPEDGLPG
jgi:hypothetical protein